MVPNQFSPTVNNLTHCRGRKLPVSRNFKTIKPARSAGNQFLSVVTANDAN